MSITQTFAMCAYFLFCIALVFHAVYREKKAIHERDAWRKKYEIEHEKTCALESELKSRYGRVFIKIPRAQIDKAFLN